jgi:hypothetical protein
VRRMSQVRAARNKHRCQQRAGFRSLRCRSRQPEMTQVHRVNCNRDVTAAVWTGLDRGTLRLPGVPPNIQVCCMRGEYDR